MKSKPKPNLDLRSRFIKLIREVTQERSAMMRKRHAYFSTLVAPYSSIEEFARDKEEWFALMGMDFSVGEKGASIYIQLDYAEYEQYHIVLDANGKPVVSHVIWWQHPVYCCNEVFNIFTQKSVDEEDIYTSY